MGIVLRKIKRINNYKCSEIVKMSKRNLKMSKIVPKNIKNNQKTIKKYFGEVKF